MKKNELKVVAVILLIIVLVLIWAVVTKQNDNNEKNNANQNLQLAQNQTNIPNVSNEEFVKLKDDGTKVNTSNKLKQDKKFNNLTITNISLQSKQNETILLATVNNPTNETNGDYSIKLNIKDKEGKTIKQISGYINSIVPNGKTTLRIKTSYDFANAYDFEIVK